MKPATQRLPKSHGLSGVLQCPKCKDCSLHASEEGIFCQKCSSLFKTDASGVIDFVFHRDYPLSPEYYSEEFRRGSSLMYENYEYYENGNRLFNAIHFSGHKTLHAWAKQYLDSLPNSHCVEADFGCGGGAHADYYLTPHPLALDILPTSLQALKKRFPGAVALASDQMALPLQDESIDIAYSVYNLEHIFHLRLSLQSLYRVMKPEGRLFVSIPCEGGWAWNLGRQFTSARHFKKLGVDYAKLIRLEHCNTAKEIVRSLAYYFDTVRTDFFPLKALPTFNANLTYSLELKKKVSPK